MISDFYYELGALIFVGFVVAGNIISSKNERLFNKKLAKQMLEKDDTYFEVKYLKNILLLYLLASIVLSIFLLGAAFDQEFWLLYFCLGVIAPFVGIANYIYKSMYKIVFDNGQVTLYVGNKIKMTDTLMPDRIDSIFEPRTIFSNFRSGTLPYRIIFKAETRERGWVSFNEDMDNSYKLVAILEKGAYFKKKKAKKNKK